MQTTRRGFLGAMLSASMAPAIVRADSLMKLVLPSQELILPEGRLVHGQLVIELGNESWNSSFPGLLPERSLEEQCGIGVWSSLPRNAIHPGSREGFYYIVPGQSNASGAIYNETRRQVRIPDLTKLRSRRQ